MTEKKQEKRDWKKRPYDLHPDMDGITHINIYSKGKTDLGVVLSNFSHHPFCHVEHGLFASVEGYWYWLTRQEDELRHVYGFKAKELGRSLPEVKKWHPEQFQNFVCQALDAKLESHPWILEELKKSHLPLEHYYARFYGDQLKVTEPGNSEWIIAHFEKVRVSLNPEADVSTIKRMEAREIAKQKKADMETQQPSLF